ncbi:MAG TPA: hypothetical protein PLF78_06260 [Caulobacter sp.]|nr:hypothetical protein [Caulobacter sp.]
MTRALYLTLPILALLAACDQAPKGVDVNKLDAAVGEAVGDPNTCVLLVTKGGGDVVYRYGTHANCRRPLPSCQGEASLSAEALGKLAAAGETRTVSCDSGPNGENRVAWASGPAPKSAGAKHGDLAYAALMEGPGVLPGREIAIRLEAALVKGGL